MKRMMILIIKQNDNENKENRVERLARPQKQIFLFGFLSFIREEKKPIKY